MRLAYEPKDLDIGGGVMLFDLDTNGHLVEDRLPVSEGGLGNVAFSPDGKILAAGYSLLRVSNVNASPIQVVGQGGAVLWDFTTYEPQKRSPLKRLEKSPLSMGEGDVKCISFSRDSKTLAVGYGIRGSVMLWDVATLVPVVGGPLRVPDSYIESVAFSPDGKRIAVGYSSHRKLDYAAHHGGVVLWDVATREHPDNVVLDVPEGSVLNVAFSPDGETLRRQVGVGGGGGGGVVLWNVASRERQPKDPFLIPESEFGGLAFSHDGNVLAAGYGIGRRGGVRLWDKAGPGLMAGGQPSVGEGRVHSVALP